MNILQQQQQKYALKFDEKYILKFPLFWLFYGYIIKLSVFLEGIFWRKPLLIFIETDEQYIFYIYTKKTQKTSFWHIDAFRLEGDEKRSSECDQPLVTEDGDLIDGLSDWYLNSSCTCSIWAAKLYWRDQFLLRQALTEI